MNSTNETLLFDRFLIMYNLCVFTCIIFIFVFHCTHVRMSYVLNSYLLYFLTYLVAVVMVLRIFTGFQTFRTQVFRTLAISNLDPITLILSQPLPLTLTLTPNPNTNTNTNPNPNPNPNGTRGT